LKKSLEFLTELEKNNNRDWFNLNKKRFEELKEELLNLVSKVLKGANSFEPEVINQPAKGFVFRIYRDTRFSLNKAPYKNNIGAWISKGGKKSPSAGFYIHIQPRASFVAAGLWMPESAVLNAIRQHIHFNSKTLRDILSSKSFKVYFKELDDHRLKTNPKGFDKNHPAIDLLKYKSFVASFPLADSKLINTEKLAADIIKVFQASAPLVNFINDAIDTDLN